MMNDETTNESASPGWLDRIKESPRTVSALIIILIVAAAIYAFSGEPTPSTPEPPGTAPTATDTEAAADQAVEKKTTDSQQTDEATAPATPPVERQDGAYVESAQAGDGITHLARRATTRWVVENAAGYEVTKEHRIFIEDYIQNRLGTDRLSIGETRTIQFDLISEAVKQAGELSDAQLRNLSQYTAALS